MLQQSGLSAIGDILRHRCLSLFGHVSCLDPGVPTHDALHLMVDTYEGRKPMASCRRPPGRPRNVWLNKVQEDANALCCEDLRLPGVMERCDGPLGLRDDDDDDDVDVDVDDDDVDVIHIMSCVCVCVCVCVVFASLGMLLTKTKGLYKCQFLSTYPSLLLLTELIGHPACKRSCISSPEKFSFGGLA